MTWLGSSNPTEANWRSPISGIPGSSDNYCTAHSTSIPNATIVSWHRLLANGPLPIASSRVFLLTQQAVELILAQRHSGCRERKDIRREPPLAFSPQNYWYWQNLALCALRAVLLEWKALCKPCALHKWEFVFSRKYSSARYCPDSLLIIPNIIILSGNNEQYSVCRNHLFCRRGDGGWNKCCIKNQWRW